MCHVEHSTQQIQQFIDKQLVGKSQDGMGIMLLGGPGSGKNTLIDHITSTFGFHKQSFVLIDTDPILEALYQNNEHCRESSANPINDILCKTTIKGRYNYIYCGTGRNSEYVLEKIIKPSKKQHYTIYLSVILNTIDVAIPRIMKRSLETNRNTNITFVKNVYSTLEQYIQHYINLDCSLIDGIIVVDNSSNDFKPQLMYTSSCKNDIKSVKCYDAANKYQYLTEFCPSLWNDIGKMLCNGIMIAAFIGIVTYCVMIYKLHWSYVFIMSAAIPYYTAKWTIHHTTIKETVLLFLLTAAFVFFSLLERFSISESLAISIVVGTIAGTTWYNTK